MILFKCFSEILVIQCLCGVYIYLIIKLIVVITGPVFFKSGFSCFIIFSCLETFLVLSTIFFAVTMLKNMLKTPVYLQQFTRNKVVKNEPKLSTKTYFNFSITKLTKDLLCNLRKPI